MSGIDRLTYNEHITCAGHMDFVLNPEIVKRVITTKEQG